MSRFSFSGARALRNVMKKPLILLVGLAMSTAACETYVAGPPPPPPGPGYYGPGPSIGVVVEDRPYYVHGPRYYSRGVVYRWRPGHYVIRNGRRVWIHGRYAGTGP